MNILRNLDAYRVIVFVCLVLLPIGWWIVRDLE